MFVRFANVALVAGLFTLVACSAPESTETESSGDAITKGDLPDNANDEESEGNGKEGTVTDGDEQANADGGTGKPPSDDNDPPANPACVASCNTSLKSKCGGEDGFCESLCQWVTSEMLTCLIAAPTCEKPEFVRCGN